MALKQHTSKTFHFVDISPYSRNFLLGPQYCSWANPGYTFRIHHLGLKQINNINTKKTKKTKKNLQLAWKWKQTLNSSHKQPECEPRGKNKIKNLFQPIETFRTDRAIAYLSAGAKLRSETPREGGTRSDVRDRNISAPSARAAIRAKTCVRLNCHLHRRKHSHQ